MGDGEVVGVMSALPILKKRNLSGLRDDIADLEVGDQVRVHLRDKDRHGDFIVSGEVYLSMSGELSVCGFGLVDARGKPMPMLMAFDSNTPDPMGRIGGRAEHGQVVRVSVTDAGSTKGGAITGVALAGDSDDLILVGGYIVGGVRTSSVLVTDETVAMDLRTPATEVD